LSTVVAPVSASHTWTVNPDDSSDSISKTIKGASSGDIIILNPGTYYQNEITVSKDITLEANASAGGSPANTIIDAQQNWMFAGSNSLTVDNLTLENAQGGKGSAINVKNVIVTSCIVTNCKASGAVGGGAIYAWGTLTVENSSFTNCSAFQGGAIFTDCGGIIENSKFTNCNAKWGGAVDSFHNSLTVSGSTFNNCQATGRLNSAGGAIYTADMPTTVENSIFTDCSAYAAGGGIYTEKTLTISNSEFNACSADKGTAINDAAKILNYDDATILNLLPGSIYLNGKSYSPGILPPTVTGVSPASGPHSGGTVVTITGTNFIPGYTAVNFGGTAVNFGGTAPTMDFYNINETSITMASPGGTGTVNITVTTTYGTFGGGTSATSPADQFTYIAAPTPAPTVTGITPSVGLNTTPLITTNITGTNFQTTGTTTVILNQTGLFDITGTNVTVSSSGNITCMFNLVNTTAGQYNVVVINPNGLTAVLPNAFTVETPDGPYLQITGPFTPGQQVPCRENATIPADQLFLPFGSTITHTPGDFHIYRPDGSELGWGNDWESVSYNVSTGGRIMASFVYIVPSASQVTPVPGEAGRVDVTNPSTNTTVLKTINKNVNKVDNSSQLMGVYVPSGGCSAGVTTNNEYFLSSPLPPAVITSTGIPGLSVQQMSDGSHIVTVSINGSTNPADTTSIQLDKTLVNPNQGLTFNVFSTTSGQNAALTAKAEVIGGDAALHYNITGTYNIPGISSVAGPNISITPRIYKITPAGDELMFTGEPTTCTSGTTCTVTGDFVPAVWDVSNITSPFFANATVSFTSSPSYKLFSGISGENGPDQVDTQPLSQDGLTVPEIVVTGPLSLMEPGNLTSAAKVKNAVPYGGTIEHVIDEWNVPMTIVYNSSGFSQYQANDLDATMLPVPAGAIVPATHISQVPSDSFAKAGAENLTVYLDDEKILTINGSSQVSSYEPNTLHSEGMIRTNLGSNLPGEWNGWVEDANTITSGYTNQVDNFTAYWKVPSKPDIKGTSTTYRTQFLFNAFQGPQAIHKDDVSILQPVLEWSQGGHLNQWTIQSVAGPYNPAGDYLYGSTYSVNEGDVIIGIISWSDKYQWWEIVTIDQNDTSKNSRITTDMVNSNKSLMVYGGVYEAYNISSKATMIHDSEFYDMSYKYLNGNSVPISLSKNVLCTINAIRDHLDVNIVTNPSDVQLITQK
jgi:hypothetical protein